MSNSSGTAGKSVLASDLKIVGDVVATGAIEVMGEIDGSITADSLLVSGDGAVKGTIVAQTVDLRGKLNGKITTGALTLRSAAQVVADVTYTTITIESGAQIEGTFTLKKGQ